MALNQKAKLVAVETFLGWRMDSEEQCREILDQIYYVVCESRLKPEDEHAAQK